MLDVNHTVCKYFTYINTKNLIICISNALKIYVDVNIHIYLYAYIYIYVYIVIYTKVHIFKYTCLMDTTYKYLDTYFYKHFVVCMHTLQYIHTCM